MKSKALKWLNSQVNDGTTKAEIDIIEFLKKVVKCYVEKEKVVKAEFVPPTLAEIQEYVNLKQYNVDVNKFYTYYTESGWHDGRGKPIKNWKLKLLVWDKPKLNSYGSFKTQPKRIDTTTKTDIGVFRI